MVSWFESKSRSNAQKELWRMDEGVRSLHPRSILAEPEFIHNSHVRYMKTNLLPVKPFQETLRQGMCGPASLKMVFSYYGIEKSEREIAKMCGVDRILGTNDRTLKRVAEKLGLKAEIKNRSTFEDLEGWLGRKVPVIVDWFTRGRADYNESAVADGHYSVVMGLDKKNIYLQDPEIGAVRVIKRDDFLRVWFDFQGDRIVSWKDMIVRQLIVIYPEK